MQNLKARLDIISERIQKIISLQAESKAKVEQLQDENRELIRKIHLLESQNVMHVQTQAENSIIRETLNNNQNKEINNKINLLIKEVEQCIAWLKSSSPDETNPSEGD